MLSPSPRPIAELKEYFKPPWKVEPRRVVTITHERPDGDAVGSSMAMVNYLRQCGHEATAIFPTEVPNALSWVPGMEHSIIAEEQPEQAKALIEQAEMLVLLDFGITSRAGGFLQELIQNFHGLILHSDHHIELEPVAHYLYRDEHASSTCELVGRMLSELGYNYTSQVAQCLYLGIMTDTASFRFDSVTPELHRLVAQLLETGLHVSAIHNAVYNNFAERRLRFLGYCLGEGLHVLPELHTAYIKVPQQVYQRFGLQTGDTEGIVNYTLTIQGIRFGVIMVEYPGKVKLSFRSIGGFSANEFASHFNGGGHFNAAGGRSLEDINKTEARFLRILQDYQAKLTTAD